jgi:hypothetical protein
MRNNHTCASPKVKGRALVTVLSLSILWSCTLGINSAYAYTVDDLRVFVGGHSINL